MVNSIAVSKSAVYAVQDSKLYKLSRDLKIESETNIDMSKIGLTSDGSFLLGIGDKEKTILVIDPESLEVVYKHTFPKRPSSWSVCGENLVVSDKFGDVFSVKLNTPLTDAERKDMEPILGHVSMVLDVVATPDSVLTSDRDEHVRISRYPNAFIIENFLLGSPAYIAHLQLNDETLVTAGGSGSVIAWNWKKGTELARTDIGEHLALPDPQEVDVLGLTVSGNNVWAAVEDDKRVVKLSLPNLDIETVYTLPQPANALASYDTSAYAALPDGVCMVGENTNEVKLPGKADSNTQKHLKKTPRN